MNNINLCEVCGNDVLEHVVNLGNHPMCDDLVKVRNKRICEEYPIEILYCKNCKTAHQKYQVPKKKLFPKNYHYRSRFTADVLKGMDDFVVSCEEQIGTLKNKKVLDVGCNDGSLLDIFKKKGAFTYGIEPTNASLDAKEKGHIIFHEYLSKKLVKHIVENHNKPDIITFTNVFAHIENLKELLQSVKTLVKSNTIVVIENHYLGSVLEKNQFDTFYHEHPRTYSYNSFLNIAFNLNLELLNVEFPSRYGGNIRVIMGKNVSISNKIDDLEKEKLTKTEENFYHKFIVLSKKIEQWKKIKLYDLKTEFNKYGKLRAKAFPGRAAILIKLLGLDEKIISAVYEKPGSLKINHYVPGTRIPIKSDSDMPKSSKKDEPILNLAWHISTEIRNYLKKNGHEDPVIDILSIDDFK